MRRTNAEPDPRCWWCGTTIDYQNPSRGLEPGLPTGTGVCVCGPDCPDREGREVFMRPMR